MTKLLLLTVAVVIVALSAGQTEAQAKQARSCSYAEINTLGLTMKVDDWMVWNQMHQRVFDIEKARACAKIPARWRWVNSAFKRSTQVVDRLYPGRRHGSWAYNCASSEGGHGMFVMNRNGSGAGGWLQFMSGTFWSVIYQAVARARVYGVRVPSYALTWTSPLGQALAGSEMLFRNRRSEWTGATC